ncbi:MAG: hypothetical protein LUQ22_04985 [Methanotrichaceae archaeon]|nr:hypothetical protein [Methanotrichaceae archaeon]
MFEGERRLKPLKFKLLERIQACPGLDLEEVYRPFLKDYSESSVHSILRILKEEGMIQLVRQSNEILFFASEVTNYGKTTNS